MSDLLGKYVRIHPAWDLRREHRPMAEGLVVARSDGPTVVVRTCDGGQSSWVASLAVEAEMARPCVDHRCVGVQACPRCGGPAPCAHDTCGCDKRTRRWVVGTYCPRGGGHFALIASDDYDPSCGGKGWPVYIDVEDGDDISALPDGYWEDEQ